VKLSTLTALLDWTMKIIMAAALLAMMVLTFVDVLGRYAFNAPVFGAGEMISYLLAITLFAGLAFVSGERSHISITLFDGWLDRNVGAARQLFIQVFCLAALALLAVELFRHGLRMIHARNTTIVLDWSLWPLTMAMAAMAAIGLALLAAPRRHPPRAPAEPHGGGSL
jgi:TRAP-type C4-dicarboxylate transport system permease small subunit